jgi:hypothetical protein
MRLGFEYFGSECVRSEGLETQPHQIQIGPRGVGAGNGYCHVRLTYRSVSRIKGRCETVVYYVRRWGSSSDRVLGEINALRRRSLGPGTHISPLSGLANWSMETSIRET